MTPNSSRESTESSQISPITDPLSLRERDNIQFQKDTETVDEDTLNMVDRLEDMVVVGVTNAEGEVLMRRWTESCSWKLPIQELKPDEDYTEAAKRAVEEDIGLPIELDNVAGVWHYEASLQNREHVATRSFVVFSASPAKSNKEQTRDALDTSGDDQPAAVGWFTELPTEEEQAPGTGIFIE